MNFCRTTGTLLNGGADFDELLFNSGHFSRVFQKYCLITLQTFQIDLSQFVTQNIERVKRHRGSFINRRVSRVVLSQFDRSICLCWWYSSKLTNNRYDIRPEVIRSSSLRLRSSFFAIIHARFAW